MSIACTLNSTRNERSVFFESVNDTILGKINDKVPTVNDPDNVSEQIEQLFNNIKRAHEKYR